MSHELAVPCVPAGVQINVRALRAHLAGVMRPNAVVSEKESRKLMPLVTMTDCKSLYDSVHRLAGPRAPTEKRLVVDLAALRQLILAEQGAWAGRLEKDKSALRWVPTTCQRADALTKVRQDVSSWWTSIRQIHLPLKPVQGLHSTVGVSI